MTKQQWKTHIIETGMTARQHVAAHPDCPLCAARRKTRARNEAARERAGAMRDLGLVRVRGNLGGVYWE